VLSAAIWSVVSAINWSVFSGTDLARGQHAEVARFHRVHLQSWSGPPACIGGQGGDLRGGQRDQLVAGQRMHLVVAERGQLRW
jgi:hypothetical protein